jgi:hypothetical protein
MECMMSIGSQIDPVRAELDAVEGGVAAPTGNGVPNSTGAAYPTDEEILGIVLPSSAGRHGDQAAGSGGQIREGNHQRDSSGNDHPPNDNRPSNDDIATMPEWLRASVADPKYGPEVQQEAQRLWQEHQAFRAALSSPDEARAINELFPGGAAEARALRQSNDEFRQSAHELRETIRAIDQFDAAIFSGDARAQSELVTELARANPAAFRSLFAEAAKVLGNTGSTGENTSSSGPTLRDGRLEWDTQPENTEQGRTSVPLRGDRRKLTQRLDPPFADGAKSGAPGTSHTTAPVRAETGHAGAAAPGGASSTAPQFDRAAYASFERTTNDAVARDVRASVRETLNRVLPEGIAEGAARRIGEDIFNEIHRTLASDRTLSSQVGEVLREWKFGAAEQQRVASLLAGRAKQLVPSVARRVIGEWTGSVLVTARSRETRRAAAASRVDIAAPGGSLDSMPLRPMSAREINYGSMSDDEILGM